MSIVPAHGSGPGQASKSGRPSSRSMTLTVGPSVRQPSGTSVSLRIIARLYGSCPVEQAADQIRSRRCVARAATSRGMIDFSNSA